MAIMLSYRGRGLPAEPGETKTGLNALRFRPAPYDFQREHTCHLTTKISVSVKRNFVKTFDPKNLGNFTRYIRNFIVMIEAILVY